MDCWEILGIRKTEDQEEIRKAYYKQLPHFHPEENPEGFRALRQAMEEALEIAAETAGAQETAMMDSRELRDLVKEAGEVYRDFGRRICPDQWKTLASASVCQDLETQKEAGWALLGFLMNHFHIPHDCYQALDQIFGWQEAEEELYRRFSEGFVRYLMYRIREEDSFRYDRTPVRDDFDYEGFFEACFQLRSALRDKDRELAEKTIGELEAMDMDHPDLTVLKIRHFSMIQGKEEETWKLAEQLYKTHGDLASARYWYARLALETEREQVDDEELEDILGGLVKEEPDNSGYWQLCGSFMEKKNCLRDALGMLKRARACTEESWDYLEEQIIKVARAWSVQLEEEGSQDPWELAVVCWDGKRYDRVRELLSQVEPPQDKTGQWLYMMAESCSRLQDYEKALECRKAIWDSCEEKNRSLELYMDLAEDYRLAGHREKALELYGLAAETFSPNPEIFYRQARILEEDGRSKEAALMCSRALEAGFHREAFNLRLALLLDMDQFEQVREEAEKIMEQGYRPAQVLYDYAKALRELEDYDGAEKVLKELYERTDGSEMVSEEYAWLYIDMERYEEALKWVLEAIEKRDTFRRQYLKGGILRGLKRYEEEAAVYRGLMDQGEDGYYICYRMGRALERINRFEEAETWLRKAIERQGGVGEAWDSLGDVLQKQGKWKEAVTAYEAGTELENLQSARDLCRLLKRLHEDQKAGEWIGKCLKKWPEDGSLLLLCSDILYREKKYEEAVRCLNRYIEVRPAQTERGYREIAQCYERAGDLHKAREYYQKAIDLSPGNARCWRLMGKFLANEVKDQEQALPYLEKAAQLAPDSTYGFMKLGEVYEALGRREEAVKCYERSLENYKADLDKDPDDCCSYEGISDVLVHLGRLEEAEEMARRAISLECRVFTCSCPYCFESYEDLAKVEERRGNLEKALEYMEKAGQYSVTDYYPNEIARLKEALKARSESL